MRLSLKRLLIFAYLIVCAFFSFVNYRYTTTDYASESVTKIAEDRWSDQSRIEKEKTRSNRTQSIKNIETNFWQKLKNGFMSELAAAIPKRILLPVSKSSGLKAVSRKPVIDRALWPEESNTSDRIVAQIEFTVEDPPTDASPTDQEPKPKKSILVYLPHGLRAWSVEKGDKEFKRQQCRVSNCELTDYKSDAEKADAVVFRNHFSGGFMRHSEKQIWIFYTLESPENTPSLILFKDTINWTATYRFDSDLVTPYEKFRSYSEEELAAKRSVSKSIGTSESIGGHVAQKTKQVAWFVSNCLTSNRRHEYVQQLARHVRVDIYGACGPFRCSRYDPKCGKLLDDEYRFYLAFENSNCRDYITEKFFVQGLQ